MAQYYIFIVSARGNVWSRRRHSIVSSVCWPRRFTLRPHLTWYNPTNKNTSWPVPIVNQVTGSATCAFSKVSYNARRPVRCCGWAGCGMHWTDGDGVIWKCVRVRRLSTFSLPIPPPYNLILFRVRYQNGKARSPTASYDFVRSSVCLSRHISVTTKSFNMGVNQKLNTIIMLI